jgi:acetyl/propionyl-CoA carboxylase alpha subunit
VTPPFRRVLVANRGEIAVRLVRACHELGCEVVAVYSDADADAPHVRAADVAVRIGPPPATDSYLRVDAILDAARVTGADAIHPGYGFLSERASFARACEEAGIVFVGPAAETLAGLGDKLAARRAAARVGVPVVPGTLEPAPVHEPGAVAALIAEADRVGWPLLVKASAGGGGRGMRRVDRPADLVEALRAASAEAEGAFGDGAVYLERYVSDARHVEVQLLGDVAGTVVALGERDCSVQRRHQKLLEEAPAPGLSREQRRAVHGLAVEVAGAFGLRNAATAEFLLAPDGSFWFLEVNTRLQVEHGVTELVTGLDLVHEQLRIAAGAPLDGRVHAAASHAADPDRHAIEARISAEDPARGFAPSFGRIARWREPGGPGVRVDSGVEEGSIVGSHYDPLLAKLLVVAPDRPAAFARLRRALAEFEIGGIQTTLPFHAWLAADPGVADGRLSTSLVEERGDPEASRAPAAERAAWLAAAWARRHAGASGSPAGPVAGAEGGADASRWRAAGRLEGVERWPG